MTTAVMATGRISVAELVTPRIDGDPVAGRCGSGGIYRKLADELRGAPRAGRGARGPRTLSRYRMMKPKRLSHYTIYAAPETEPDPDTRIPTP